MLMQRSFYVFMYWTFKHGPRFEANTRTSWGLFSREQKIVKKKIFKCIEYKFWSQSIDFQLANDFQLLSQDNFFHDLSLYMFLLFYIFKLKTLDTLTIHVLDLYSFDFVKNLFLTWESNFLYVYLLQS